MTKVVRAVTPEVKDALVRNIRRRMTLQPLEIRADIEMKCFQFDGVLHIKVLMPDFSQISLLLFFNLSRIHFFIEILDATMLRIFCAIK